MKDTMSENKQDESISDDEKRKYSMLVWNYRQAETVGLMIHVGHRLGLYKSMSGAGAVSAAELAQVTGLHERWLLEWMRLQAAAQILKYHEGERFELPSAGIEMLANEDSRSFAADNFTGGTSPVIIEDLLESFRTGLGKSYESSGPEGVRRSESRHWRAAKSQVLPVMIPTLDDVERKLRNGAMVADVGTGDGAVTLTLAEAFPDSTFHAYDPNEYAVERVDEVAEQMGLQNVKTIQAAGEDLPSGSTYDLVITFDCIHDMTRPADVIAAIRKCIKPDGTWFIKDIRSKPRFEDNLRNPMLAMMYGFSIMSCMSSAMSEPGGAGLGTLGFNPEVAEKMSRDAGFSRFLMHDFKDPGNLYYEVRP
jgi:2-polyprenyl-3-methyl-5-hydroxy-6-metoxy-1,4-benzoquinol methylase